VGIGTPSKAALLLAVGAAGGAAAVAVAGVPDSNGVIHACVALQAGSTLPTATANLRVIDGTQTCSTAVPPAGGTPPEATVNWNVKGPPGQNGAPGAPGRSVTIAAGNTLTLAGGQVVHVGQSPTLTTVVLPPSTRNVATLSFTGGVTTAILEFNLAASAGYGSGGGAGKNTPHDIQITKSFDKSSTKLSLACSKGTHFKQATIAFSKPSKRVTYTMNDVLIGSYQLTSGKGGKLVDSLTLNFSKLTIKVGK
jgi:hypothetical protein